MYHSAWWFPSIYFCVFLGETTNQQIRMRLHTWHRMRPPLTITPRKLNTQRERRCFFFAVLVLGHDDGGDDDDEDEDGDDDGDGDGGDDDYD